MSNAPDSYDHPALTSLSEDERMFKEAIKSFALAEIEPLVREMESKQNINQKLITAMFEMGLMGIEIPEEFGGAQSSFFNTILLIEEISKFDPSVAILIDVQNTLVNNALCKWGSKEVQATYLPKLASEWIGAYALSESGSGSDAFGLECKATQQGSLSLIHI